MNPIQDLEPETNQHKNIGALTDTALVAAFAIEAERTKVFGEIVNRYQSRVYYHVRRIVVDHDDADDVAQSTFIRVWENLSGFRGESALFSWIYRIATNEALGFLRKKRPNVSPESVAAELAGIVDGGNLISGDLIQRQLQKEVLKLPEKQRIVFCMKYFDELSYEQISEITGTSVGALKASYFHAVRKIEEGVKQIIL